MFPEIREYTAKPAIGFIQDNDYAIANKQVCYITVGIRSARTSLGVTPKYFLNAVVKLLEYS